jgi:hypothetical protein
MVADAHGVVNPFVAWTLKPIRYTDAQAADVRSGLPVITATTIPASSLTTCIESGQEPRIIDRWQ